MRILITETTWASSSFACDLAAQGFLLSRVSTATDLIALAQLGCQDAIVLDRDLPDHPFTDVMQALNNSVRKTSICLFGTDAGKVTNESDADLVVSRKDDIGLVAARLRAAVRRKAGYAANMIRIGAVSMDLDKQMATVAGMHLDLTRYEYEILEHLALWKGTYQSRTRLMDKLYAYEGEPDSKIIDVYMARLRAKLAEAGGDPAQIHTVWGRGYRLLEDAPLALAA